MATNLATTNVFLGIMAAVSLFEALAVIGILVAGTLVVRRLLQVLDGIEDRQIAPTVTRLNAILDDLKGVTSTVKAEAERVDRAIHRAGEIVDRWRGHTGGTHH